LKFKWICDTWMCGIIKIVLLQLRQNLLQTTLKHTHSHTHTLLSTLSHIGFLVFSIFGLLLLPSMPKNNSKYSQLQQMHVQISTLKYPVIKRIEQTSLICVCLWCSFQFSCTFQLKLYRCLQGICLFNICSQLNDILICFALLE